MTEYSLMTIADYDAMIALWQATPGVGLSGADERAAIAAFIERNPHTNFIACRDGQVVGTILAGHDGRRGYLYHVAVHPSCRRQGIGDQLVRLALDSLRSQGIQKCHLFVFAINEIGNTFWQAAGWELRNDILVYSKNL